MIQINKIVSYAQEAINDLAGERITQGIYVDFLNDTAMDIAEKTEMWINRYVASPNPRVTDWVTNTSYITNQIVLANNNYYLCRISHIAGVFATDLASALWLNITIWTAGVNYILGDIVYLPGPIFYQCVNANLSSINNTPPNTEFWSEFGGSLENLYSVKLPFTFAGKDIGPFRIIRVVRGVSDTDGFIAWNECTEYSQQSIGRTISGNYSFEINRTMLGPKDFAIQFVDYTGIVDNSLVLIFGGPFDINEQVVIDYVSNKPFQNNPYTLWNYLNANPVTIPEFLRNSFEWGLKSKVYRLLYDKGDESFANRTVAAEKKYTDFLREAASYVHLFQDNRSTIKIQPLNWLDECIPDNTYSNRTSG